MTKSDLWLFTKFHSVIKDLFFIKSKKRKKLTTFQNG